MSLSLVGVSFERGPGYKKYTANLPDGSKIHFGDSRYEHYADKVPKARGGGLWTNLDHKDKKRRANYRARHSKIKTKDGRLAIDVQYSPAFFSYHFLW